MAMSANSSSHSSEHLPALFFLPFLHSTQLLLLSPGLLDFLHPGHLRSCVLQPQMCVYVHRDAYVRMPHQVLQRLRIHPCFRLVTAIGVSEM